MCGLLGFSGTKNAEIDKLRFLFLCNMERGSDSTGVSGKQRFRMVGDAESFLRQPGFLTAVTNSKLVIGHTRKKSVGAINKESAHPFKIGVGDDVLYGTHNGTIQKYYLDKAVKYFNLPEQDVDSLFIYEALYANRNKKGEIEFNKVLPFIHGAMALAFKYRGNLFLYRRDGYQHGRPINIGTAKNGIYYSSEKKPLELLGITDIVELPPDKMFQFKDGVLINSVDIIKAEHDSIPSTTKQIGFDYKNNTPIRSIHDIKSRTKALALISERTNVTAPIPDKDIVKYWSESINRCVASYTKVPAEFEKVEEIDHINYKTSVLLVNVYTQSMGEILSLSDWLMFIHHKDNPDDRIWAITNDEGVAVVEFPVSLFTGDEAKFGIGLYDPVWGNEYFSGDITVKRSRVLEVALSIPFHKSNIRRKNQAQNPTNNNPGNNTGKGYVEDGEKGLLSDTNFGKKNDEANKLGGTGEHSTSKIQLHSRGYESILELEKDGYTENNTGKGGGGGTLFDVLTPLGIIDANFTSYLRDCWEWVSDMELSNKNWGKLYEGIDTNMDNWRSAFSSTPYYPSNRVIMTMLTDVLSYSKSTRSFNFKYINIPRLFEDCAIMTTYWGKDVYVMPFPLTASALLHDKKCFADRYDLENPKDYEEYATNVIDDLGVDWCEKHILIVAASGGITAGIQSRDEYLRSFEEDFVSVAIEQCEYVIKALKSSKKKKSMSLALDYLHQLSYDCKSFLSSKDYVSPRELQFTRENFLISSLKGIIKDCTKNVKSTETKENANNLIAFFDCTEELLSTTYNNFKIKYLV